MFHSSFTRGVITSCWQKLLPLFNLETIFFASSLVLLHSKGWLRFLPRVVALLSDMCMGDESDGDAAPQDDISGLSVTELILNSAGI